MTIHQLLIKNRKTPLTVSGDAFATGSEFRSEPAPASVPVVSNAATVIASGGVPGYTYVWTQVSGDAMVCNNPTGATTTWSATVPKNAIISAVWRCTVTDSASATATHDVTVSLSYTTDL
jgi:hypothetical protein